MESEQVYIWTGSPVTSINADAVASEAGRQINKFALISRVRRYLEAHPDAIRVIQRAIGGRMRWEISVEGTRLRLHSRDSGRTVLLEDARRSGGSYGREVLPPGDASASEVDRATEPSSDEQVDVATALLIVVEYDARVVYPRER